MRYLLDTNTCIAIMRNHAKAAARMSAVTPADCAVSSITAYELYTGVEKCSKPNEERAKVDLLLATVSQIDFDFTAAVEAGKVRAVLESQGQMIGPYDVLLAGHARSLSLIMATSNTNEFGRVPGLVVEDWLK